MVGSVGSGLIGLGIKGGASLVAQFSSITQSCLTLCDPTDWSGLPFPSPGDLPDSGIETVSPVSPALKGRFFTTSATWEA